MRTAESVVLTLCPPGPEDRKTSMRSSSGLMCDVHVLGLGQDGHRHGGGVDAPLGFRRRDPLDAVHAAFEFELAVDLVAGDGGDDFLEPADARGGVAQDLQLPAFALAQAGVHPEEVGGEEAGFLAAGAGPNLQDDVLVVVGVLGQHQEAEFFL